MIRADLRSRLRAADVELVILLLSRGSAYRRAAVSDSSRRKVPTRSSSSPSCWSACSRCGRMLVPSEALFFYVVLRHALRRSGVDDRDLADYLGSPDARVRPARPRLARRLERRRAALLSRRHPRRPRGQRRRAPLQGHGPPRQLRALAGRALPRLHRGAAASGRRPRRIATTMRSAAAASAWPPTTSSPTSYGLEGVFRSAAEQFPPSGPRSTG